MNEQKRRMERCRSCPHCFDVCASYGRYPICVCSPYQGKPVTEIPACPLIQNGGKTK